MTALLRNSGKDLERMINDLNRDSPKVNLKIDMKRTMYNHLVGRQVMLTNEVLNLVD